MINILRQLKDYLRSINGNRLPSLEMLDRLIEYVEIEGIDERELIIMALNNLEKTEADQHYNALEIITRDRRKLKQYLDAELEQALHRRDSGLVIGIERLQKLLNIPPATTRRMDHETIDELLKVYDYMDRYPEMSFKDIVIKYFGGISEYDRIKKNHQRYIKKLREETRAG